MVPPACGLSLSNEPVPRSSFSEAAAAFQTKPVYTVHRETRSPRGSDTSTRLRLGERGGEEGVVEDDWGAERPWGRRGARIPGTEEG